MVITDDDKRYTIQWELYHLIVIGDHISVKEYVLYFIGGLYHNYSSLVTTVGYKRRKINLDEFFLWREHSKNS